MRLLPLLLACALVLPGCGMQEDGAVEVIWIGTEEDLLADGVRLSDAAQHLRSATDAGLVALDPQGEVIPDLAERWIITDDGLSFIFRLREEHWPNGDEMTSESVRRVLVRTIRALDGTSLALDLAPIDEIRAMTGRVIEIRLTSPVPDLLTLLAQPELAMRSADGGTGPMKMIRTEGVQTDGVQTEGVKTGGQNSITLQFKPPAERGLPDSEDWQDQVREITVIPAEASRAMALFDDGEAVIVLGGRIDHLPLVDTGPLSRGTVQLDGAIGLFGLRVRNAGGLLGDRGVREALAMALDRPALVSRYNLGGWIPTTRLVSPVLPGDIGLVGERWPNSSVDDLREIAAGRVRAWIAANAGDGADAAQISISIGQGPGLDLLLRDLTAQFATIGIDLVRADNLREADLVLTDRVARYADARWFLNQFSCSLDQGLCDEDADNVLQSAQAALDPAERAILLAQAETALTAQNIFIPIGAPLRWSLVRSNVTGFAPNFFAFHPLPPMAQIPQ